MPNYTKNYGFEKPVSDEHYDVKVQNENMDRIDSQLKSVEDEMQNGAILQSVEDVQLSIDALTETVGSKNAVNDTVHGKLNNIMSALETKGDIEKINEAVDEVNNEFIEGEATHKLKYLQTTRELIGQKIAEKGQSVSTEDTFRSYADKIEKISTECTATAEQILTGKTAFSGGNKITGTMDDRGTVTSTLTTQSQTYTIPKGYHNGTGTVKTNITNLSAGNIRKGISVGGVVGTAQSLTERTINFTGYTNRLSSDSNANITDIIDNTGVVYSTHNGNEFPVTIKIKGDVIYINHMQWYNEYMYCMNIISGGYFLRRDGKKAYITWSKTESYNTYSKSGFGYILIPTSENIKIDIVSIKD